MFESYFRPDKFMESTLERTKSLDLNAEMFFYDTRSVDTILQKINTLLPNRGRSSTDVIHAAYRQVLSREPTSLEVSDWKPAFEKEGKWEEAQTHLLRVLLSSSEFLYIP